MKSKRQRQENALKRLEAKYNKINDESGYYVGNIFYTPPMDGRKLRIKEEIRVLRQKLGIH